MVVLLQDYGKITYICQGGTFENVTVLISLRKIVFENDK